MKSNEEAENHLARGHTFYFDERNAEAAAREFRLAIELAPLWDEGYGWLSYALDNLEQLDEAITIRREAIRLAPEDPRHPIALGVCLTKKMQYGEAIQWLRKGISLKPHYGEADAHLYLAEALVANGQIAEAREEWRFVLTIEPSYPSYKHTHQEAKRMLKKHKQDAAS